MKPKCRAKAEIAIGRDLHPSEARFIDDQITQRIREDARNRASWKALTPAQRVKRAGARAARELGREAEVETWTQEDLAVLIQDIEGEAAKAGIPLKVATDRTMRVFMGANAAFGKTKLDTGKIVDMLVLDPYVLASSASYRNALRNIGPLLTHEFLHWAVYNGVLSQEQYSELSDAAFRLKVKKPPKSDKKGLEVWMKAAGGKPPSYVEFARVAYNKDSKEIQVEEAIALMLERQRAEMVADEKIPGQPVVRKALGSIIKFVRAVGRAIEKLSMPKKAALRQLAQQTTRDLTSGKLVAESLVPFKTKIKGSKPSRNVNDTVLETYRDFVDDLMEAIRAGDASAVLVHPTWTKYELQQTGNETYSSKSYNLNELFESERFKGANYFDQRGGKKNKKPVTGEEALNLLEQRARGRSPARSE